MDGIPDLRSVARFCHTPGVRFGHDPLTGGPVTNDVVIAVLAAFVGIAVGALMMLALLALVLTLGVTGFMQSLDAFWGEEWLLELHELLASALIGLAALHVTAAIVMSRIERTNLIGAMFSGVKVRWGQPSSRRP